jgi:hypothetical protein
MPSEANKKNGYGYLAARARVEAQIAQLAKTRGISVHAEIDPGPAFSSAGGHQIQLTYGRSRRVVTVDHETFVDEEFFRTLVLHQLQATIEELANSA